MATKIFKNRGVIFNDNYCQLGCQLLSIRETSFVWVGRATRRWQPKTKGIWWVTALLWNLLNKNTPSLMPTKIFKNQRGNI